MVPKEKGVISRTTFTIRRRRPANTASPTPSQPTPSRQHHLADTVQPAPSRLYRFAEFVGQKNAKGSGLPRSPSTA